MDTAARTCSLLAMLTPASRLWQGRRGVGRGQSADEGAQYGAGDGPAEAPGDGPAEAPGEGLAEAPGDAPGCGRGYSATRRERITSSPRKRSRLKTADTVTRSCGSHRIAARVPASAPVCPKATKRPSILTRETPRPYARAAYCSIFG